MSDLIDREEAIKAVDDKLDDLHSEEIAVRILKSLPSAEKTGKWIDSGNFWVVYCSICEEPVLKNEHDPILRTHKFYSYCPNCGAKMEKENE